MDLLQKGFEVELFTGLATGENVGVAASAILDLPNFVKEPDQRNLEFITCPEKNYSLLKNALLLPRIQLREWLKPRDLTILPGSTLSLGDSKKFERSDSSDEYHQLIENAYGTDVVTTSVHINLGIDNTSLLFSALRLIRCESSLLLALSASSPFLDGVATGVHSQRWLQFPKTPANVPIFLDYDHYVNWIEDKLAKKIMWNERHLWTSARPNGPNRPYDLNRLEVRICDLITNCDLLLAVTALLELRILTLSESEDTLDPLKASKLDINQLANLSDLNDMNAAKFSLDATLNHWIDGRPIKCREWIEQILESITPLAMKMDMMEVLTPIQFALNNGNQSMQWLAKYSDGFSINQLLQETIAVMEAEERLATTKQFLEG